ncbi:MAG: hypothetical protein KGI36_22050, partial [Burkholderiales bacterium]|nr:hypothetical protein [Burkholderiales bacterium]
GALAPRTPPRPARSNPDAYRSASDESALYDGSAAATVASARIGDPAAAVAPLATAAARLTPTQNRYVQAWMQARPSRR